MNQKNVLLLFGGVSPEHDISIKSVTSVASLLGNHMVIPVYITPAGSWLMYDGKLDNLQNLNWDKFGIPAILSPDRKNNGGLLRIMGDKVKNIPIDVVLPILHGPNGEDGTIQGLCQLAGIPFIGCGVTASAVAMDKAITKLVAKGLKIPQADYLSFEADQFEMDSPSILTKIGRKIGYPAFVKPAIGGSSIGISKANNRKELTEAIIEALKYCHKVVIEKSITGREIEVGILGTGMAAKASAIGEILSSEDCNFYDFEAKYNSPKSETVVPADLPDEIAQKIQDYALAIYRGIGASGLSRVDFFVEESGKIYFNEINTMPGFTNISMYAKMWEASGISRQDIIDILIMIATDGAEA